MSGQAGQPHGQRDYLLGRINYLRGLLAEGKNEEVLNFLLQFTNEERHQIEAALIKELRAAGLGSREKEVVLVKTNKEVWSS